MYLKKIQTFQYRNIEDIHLDCDPKINCIIGKNGIGKTNLLDSIYYLAFCKSNILANDGLNIQHEKDSFLIKGDFCIQDKTIQVRSAYQHKNKQKIISVDDKKYNRLSDHIGLIPLIFISPGDIQLINDGGSERRRFIDSYISIYNKEYLQNLVTYNKLLAQRNSLLKLGSGIDQTFLEVIDEKLVESGVSIYNERKTSIEELSKLSISFYSQISDKDDCSVTYDSHLDKNDFKTLLKQNFNRDVILGYTSTGIHRDDIVFGFNNALLKNTGSQGQKKSFLLSLKFAQYKSIYEKKKTPPILLLDDLFDKLDTERTKKVYEIIDGQNFGQIFITDTDKTLLESFVDNNKQDSSFWRLENGKISMQI